MELTDLRYFLNVATVESFVRGAALSHVSPAAVSKTVRKLEAELGISLFSRTTRRVVLTDAGRILLQRSRRVFEELDGLRRDLDEAADEVSGALRIGAMEVFSIYLLPLTLARLGRKYPRLVPQCHEMVPQAMEKLIVDGALDVGFTIGASNVAGLDYRLLGHSPGVLVCGRNHPLFGKARIAADEIASHPFVVPRVLGLEHLPVLDQFPEARYPRKAGATFELLQMGLQLVREGGYLGFFPRISIGRLLAEGHLRALKGLELDVTFDLHALTRTGTQPRRAITLLVDGLSQVLRRSAPT